MRAKLYRNINKFRSYSNGAYLNIYVFKVFRKTSFFPIDDRAICSYFIRSRKSALSGLKTHCFFSANGKSIYKDYFLSRFELKRYAITGSIVGLKVASWLLQIFLTFTKKNYVQVLFYCWSF